MNLKINLDIIKPYIDEDQIEQQNTENNFNETLQKAFTMYLINIEYEQTLSNLYRHLEQLQNVDCDETLLQLRYSIEHAIQYFLDLQQDLQTHASIFL